MSLSNVNYLVAICISITLAIIYTINKWMSARKEWGDWYYGYGVFKSFSLTETVVYLIYFLLGNLMGIALYFYNFVL